MAKKNIIQFDFQASSTVLGLASNEKIWKLCWVLNQALGLALATESEGISRIEGPEVYQDLHSDANFEYLLFENKAIKGSKLAQQFRYWLVIRHKRDLAPEVDALLQKLSSIDIVSLARDLSSEKDIQKLIP